MIVAADPTRCPLCGQPNACALTAERASGQPPLACWCTQLEFTQRLLDRVPALARRAACICRTCAQQDAQAAPGPLS